MCCLPDFFPTFHIYIRAVHTPFPLPCVVTITHITLCIPLLPPVPIPCDIPIAPPPPFIHSLPPTSSLTSIYPLSSPPQYRYPRKPPEIYLFSNLKKPREMGTGGRGKVD